MHTTADKIEVVNINFCYFYSNPFKKNIITTDILN